MSSDSPAPRPRVVIGFSQPGALVAEDLRAGLAEIADVDLRRDDESAGVARACDLGVFVLSGSLQQATCLRIGIYLGALGRERIMLWPLSGVEIPFDLQGLVLARQVAAVRDHLLRLAAPGAPPPRPTDQPKDQVARRLRRTLGTAASTQYGQPLRIADISQTGALLETFGEIPEGQILDLDVQLDNGRKIHVAAKVVRIQHPQWGRVGGVGVQFVRFEGNSRAILDDYLDAGAAALAASAFQPGVPIPEA